MHPLQTIIQNLKIPYFCHFTHKENLNSILEIGLLSTHLLTTLNIKFRRNDFVRFDNHTNHICLTIGYPNSRLFKTFREKYESMPHDWVVLLIDPSVLWEIPSLFCHTNSATRCGALIGNQSEYFKSFFLDPATYTTNDVQSFFPYLPIDEQAEVLVKEYIPKKYLLKCVSYDEPMYLNYSVKPDFFIKRKEFFWNRATYMNSKFSLQRKA